MPDIEEDRRYEELIREFLSYNPDTGEFVWKKSPAQNTPEGSVAGTVNDNGYIRIRFRGDLLSAHRLAWFLQTGEFPPRLLDHRNGDRGDNRFLNLRPATHKENGRNAAKLGDFSSRFKGVYWHKARKKWVASARLDGKLNHLGYFTEEEAAARAYDSFAARHFGEFAKLNLQE